MMTTVEKGNRFEDESYGLITKKLKKGTFGFSEKNAKVFQKKPYFSKRRNKEIVFDLSIEIWPAGASNYIQVFLIECKDHNDPVKIGDAELLATRVSDSADLNGKAVLISRAPFPSTVVEFAKNTGMMLIEIPPKGKSKVVVYREERMSKIGFSYEENISKFLSQALTNETSENADGTKCPRLSKPDIRRIANEFLTQAGMSGFNIRDKACMDRLYNFLEKEKGIRVEFVESLSHAGERKILGSFDANEKVIKIDKSLEGSERFAFVLMHEIGHALMHGDLKIDQSLYNSYQDSSYDIFTGRYRLQNAKNWIEWHANYFASVVLMPDDRVEFELVRLQKMFGISRIGYIYLDNQTVNRADFRKILQQMSCTFSVTKTSIVYKLNEMGLIEYAGRNRNTEHVSRILHQVISQWETPKLAGF